MKHADKQRQPSDEPRLDNYPTLEAWLTDINARCLWQADVESSMRSVEAWTANGNMFVIVMYECRRGFNIFTALDSINIADTFADAERRMGIPEPEISATFGLPVNPPAMHHIPLAELLARSGVARVGNMISAPVGEGAIWWFWTYDNRTWAVGPYRRRSEASRAYQKYLTLTNGPMIRHAWVV